MNILNLLYLFDFGLFPIGFCYAELRCRWPRMNADAYEYIYLTVGEAPGFAAGWLLLLQKLTLASAVARSTSSNFDAILNYRIFNMTRTHIGAISSSTGTYPDLVAPFILIMICTLITVGYRPPKLCVLVCNAGVILIAIFTLIVALFHFQFSYWSNNLFFQNGAHGVSCNISFIFCNKFSHFE